MNCTAVVMEKIEQVRLGFQCLRKSYVRSNRGALRDVCCLTANAARNYDTQAESATSHCGEVQVVEKSLQVNDEISPRPDSIKASRTRCPTL